MLIVVVVIYSLLLFRLLFLFSVVFCVAFICGTVGNH